MPPVAGSDNSAASSAATATSGSKTSLSDTLNNIPSAAMTFTKNNADVLAVVCGFIGFSGFTTSLFAQDAINAINATFHQSETACPYLSNSHLQSDKIE